MRLELPPNLLARLQASGEEEENTQLNQVWQEIDEDGSGELDVEEFIELVRRLREMLNMKPLSDAKARKQFKKLDQDGGGTLDQEEFKSFWKKQRKAASKQEKQRTVYFVVLADKADGLDNDAARRRWLRALQEGARYESLRS